MFSLIAALLVVFALVIVLVPLRRRKLAAAAPRWPVVLITVALPASATVLYLSFGNPAALETAAPVAALAPAALTRRELPDFIARLETHLKHATNDGRAWVLLARARLEHDDFTAAAHAYEKALAVDRKIAQDPGIWCELADALGMAQGGSLRGRPRTLIERALVLRADHPRALEMAGSAAYETGEYEATLSHWGRLLTQLPPRSEAHGELQAANRTDAAAGSRTQC